MPAARFSALTAVERATALADPGSLQIVPAATAEASSLLTARGRIGGRPALFVLTDGQQRGGTVGLLEARQFSAALSGATRRRQAIVACWDTGGVRVQEGPAALAATSAVGVALAELALRGTPVAAVISGTRGCFGAPAVVAAVGQTTIQTGDALWGLTGPQLFERGSDDVDAARAVLSGAARRRAGHVSGLVADSPGAIRRALARALERPSRRVGGREIIDDCVRATAALVEQLEPPPPPPAARRRRDFFVYSLRRQWKPLGPSVRRDHVHAVWGELAGAPAMGIIIGPERSHDGLGVADAHAVLEAVQIAHAMSPGAPAPILTFLFCRGHATTLRDERAGLPRALANCLRGLVAARLLGHPLLCVLGGGAYGAAYLTLAAPSHRVLAIRGTTVAPMAPRVLAAFQHVRGIRAAADTPADPARMIPEIRIVDSIVRLPRALGDELDVARRAAAGQPRVRRLAALR